MEIIESSYSEYSLIFKKPYHAFNSATFNDLNRFKCDGVFYLLFKDNKYRLGLIAGVKNNILISPFSAPFGGFSFLKDDIRLSHIEDSIRLLDRFMIKKGLAGIKIVLPPIFYNETFHAKQSNVLYRNQFQILNLDLDFYIDLGKFAKYPNLMWKNARKNLEISNEQSLEFRKCENHSEINEVYEVIKANRIFKDKPMNMEFVEILNTDKIIKTDFFLCLKNYQSISSAIVYHITDDTVYVPYWGDRHGYSEMKPMNFLSYKIFEYYYNEGKRIVHIGIATEDSIPNYGLCEFKESIGCKVTPKFTYFKNSELYGG